MNDKMQVENAGIRSAIIIDDGYDEVPQVAELLDESAWDSLFDDAQGGEAARIADLFHGYDPDNREELKSDQGFIEVLWKGRDGIRDLLGGLFDDYEQKTEDNRPFLRAAEATLESLEIPFEKCGRDFVQEAVNADLIIIDLFLGIQQGVQDRRLTVQRLKEAIRRRQDCPLPSIVLMSQVPGIGNLAKEFRQDVQLHASAFRHVRKNDLSKPGWMEGLILTLATHRSDSQALATFVDTWETKAIEAVHAAAGTLRKIDIDDLQHIRSMLLRFEGLNTSSYLLDIFDRVLQHEIESYSDVLEAAIPLDDIADDAPLMISNDRDTYAILEQTLFVHPNRRTHATGAEWPITFGDILGPKPGIQVKTRRFFSGKDNLVFFVASPECDLIRKGGLKTALLMAGSLKEIDMIKPGLAVTAKTTPVITLEGGQRYQVDWDFGNLRTIDLGQAKRLLHPDRGYVSVVARLREGSALSLRHQLLSDIGRVAELAPLPRSSTFRADLYLPLQQGGIQPVQMPDGVAITGNVLIPRRGKFAAAIIDSNCEQELTSTLLGLCLANVANKSRDSFETLKEHSRIRQLFRSGLQGIELPLSNSRAAGLLKLGEEQPDSDEKKPKTDKVATIVMGNDIKAELGDGLRRAGLIVRIHSDDTD